MENTINKNGQRSMNATSTRPSNTGPPARSPAKHQTKAGQDTSQSVTMKWCNVYSLNKYYCDVSIFGELQEILIGQSAQITGSQVFDDCQ
jgi:hypothetical protein